MDTVGLYIHIPFCKMKCNYCDFPSFAGKEKLMVDYAKALSIEIEEACQEKLIKSIFIGGGTPTYLCIEGWKIIAEVIKKLNIKEDDFEFTIEGNPKTFNEEQLVIFKEMGVNRISMGLQAVQGCHLKTLGRIHSYEDFLHSYNMLKKAGFDNINADLMFGLPGQTLNDWKESLRAIADLELPHISCYSLIIEEGTPFYKMYEEDKLILPSEDVERAMYKETLDFLKSRGYHQYEISNFAKEGYECKHNKIYWSMENYVGCGSSAHSYDEGVRYRNEEKVERYIKDMLEKGTARVEEHRNLEKDDIEEFMFLGLRKIEGVSIDEFKKRFRVSIYDEYGDIIKKYEELNLLKVENGMLFLTPHGIEISNNIMADFLL